MPALSTYEESLQKLLEGLLSTHGVPGATVGVIRAGEEIVVASGLANAGADIEATPDTVYQIGSISKLYTATMTMQLSHTGLFELDEPVRGALHEFRVRDEVATLSITPRHLLSHTSGIQGDHFLDCGRNPDALWRYVSTLDEIGQVHAPDDLYSFCNAGFGVLGRLIEEQTGDHFSRALFRRLLKPLGLERTFTQAEHAIVHRVAAGHRQRVGTEAEVQQWTLAQFQTPVGGILASAGDVLQFARLHLTNGKSSAGKQVVPARAIATMRESQTEIPGSTDERGLGWVLHDFNGTTVLGHDGDTIGQRTFLRVFPDQDAAIVVLTNSPLGGHIAAGVIAAVCADLLALEAPTVPEPCHPDDAPDADRCNGIYERMHQRLAVAAAGDGTLRMTIIPDEEFVLAGMGERTLTLEPVDHERWVTTDPQTGVKTVVTMVGEEDRPEYVHFGGRAHQRLA